MSDTAGRIGRKALEELAYELGRKFGQQRAQLNAEVAGLRAEVAALRAELEAVKKQLPLRTVAGKAA